MRMGGFSWLSRRGTAGDPTHALFAGQSHSIPDNVMALLGQLRAWNCSLGTYDLQLRGYSAGGLKFGRACGRAAIAGPVPLRTERAFAQGSIGAVSP